jgi:hypothetical protein
VEGHHDFQAAGLDLQQVESFYGFTESAAADLFNDSDTMIGVDNLVADVEITVDTQH